jgi:hypothetical protein
VLQFVHLLGWISLKLPFKGEKAESSNKNNLKPNQIFKCSLNKKTPQLYWNWVRKERNQNCYSID